MNTIRRQAFDKFEKMLYEIINSFDNMFNSRNLNVTDNNIVFDKDDLFKETLRLFNELLQHVILPNEEDISLDFVSQKVEEIRSELDRLRTLQNKMYEDILVEEQEVNSRLQESLEAEHILKYEENVKELEKEKEKGYLMQHRLPARVHVTDLAINRILKSVEELNTQLGESVLGLSRTPMNSIYATESLLSFYLVHELLVNKINTNISLDSIYELVNPAYVMSQRNLLDSLSINKDSIMDLSEPFPAYIDITDLIEHMDIIKFTNVADCYDALFYASATHGSLHENIMFSSDIAKYNILEITNSSNVFKTVLEYNPDIYSTWVTIKIMEYLEVRDIGVPPVRDIIFLDYKNLISYITDTLEIVKNGADVYTINDEKIPVDLESKLPIYEMPVFCEEYFREHLKYNPDTEDYKLNEKLYLNLADVNLSEFRQELSIFGLVEPKLLTLENINNTDDDVPTKISTEFNITDGNRKTQAIEPKYYMSCNLMDLLSRCVVSYPDPAEYLSRNELELTDFELMHHIRKDIGIVVDSFLMNFYVNTIYKNLNLFDNLTRKQTSELEGFPKEDEFYMDSDALIIISKEFFSNDVIDNSSFQEYLSIDSKSTTTPVQYLNNIIDKYNSSEEAKELLKIKPIVCKEGFSDDGLLSVWYTISTIQEVAELTLPKIKESFITLKDTFSLYPYSLLDMFNTYNMSIKHMYKKGKADGFSDEDVNTSINSLVKLWDINFVGSFLTKNPNMIDVFKDSKVAKSEISINNFMSAVMFLLVRYSQSANPNEYSALKQVPNITDKDILSGEKFKFISMNDFHTAIDLVTMGLEDNGTVEYSNYVDRIDLINDISVARSYSDLEHNIDYENLKLTSGYASYERSFLDYITINTDLLTISKNTYMLGAMYSFYMNNTGKSLMNDFNDVSGFSNISRIIVQVLAKLFNVDSKSTVEESVIEQLSVDLQDAEVALEMSVDLQDAEVALEMFTDSEPLVEEKVIPDVSVVKKSSKKSSSK
jgi:hypothetical protein